MLSQSQSQAASLKPFLNHYGETTSEQIEKNQAAMELLKNCLSEELLPDEIVDRQSYLEALKEKIDSQRPLGAKLYSDR